DASHCDALEARASEIYSACARHELVAQGTRRMAAALRFLDGRIGTLLAMTGGTSEHGRSPTAAEEVGSPPSQTQRFETSSTQTTTPADPFTRLAAAVVAAAERPARPSREPLGALKALTPEETLALFS